jgi:hypothetical protein
MIGRVRRLAFVVAGAAVVLAGCGNDGEDAEPTSTLSVPEGIALGDQPATTAPATTSPPPAIPTEIVLAADGVSGYPIGSATRVDVMAALAPVLGEPVVEDTECPGGSDTSMRWEDGPTLLFAGGQLSGWSYDGGDKPVIPIHTDAGIAPGDTVADLRAAYPENFQWVPDSTLGVEFYIGTGFPYLGGVTTGEGATDTVDVLWAGDACVFR